MLLEFWREACKQLDLGESIVRLGELARRMVPVDVVIVRRLSIEEGLIETVALTVCGSAPIPRHARTELRADDVARIASWLDEGSVLRGSRRDRSPLLLALVPKDVAGQVMVVALGSGLAEAGALVLVRAGAERFSDAEMDDARSLREPFSVALQNDRQVHQLTRLREAAEAENRALLTRLKRQEIVEEIVGADTTLRGVMQQVEQVAPTNAPVLILGETGTGKEVVARAIHDRSARREGPVVRVNCGAIPPELIDSELFGHEKGSFTGAVNERSGWFERADGGTLFLDEIGELSLAAQVRMLRVLQDGSYERVGGTKTRTADVRLVAATHRNMDRLVANGQFREDLWYRISVFPIYLPPLRARQEDFLALVRHFARNAGMRMGDVPLEPTAEDLRLLASYPWPGNVRELSAVIERATILGGGQWLDIRGAMGTKLHAAAAAASQPVAPAQGGSPIQTLDQAMAAHIERALEQTNGRVEGPFGAARLLGINPNTLRARMRKLGVEWGRFRGP